jgi:endonuclease YncB( thermonuclease family)
VAALTGPGPEVEGRVEVLDGDTLRLPDGRKLRLAAIDTPELGRPGAQQAAECLAGLLQGRRLRLQPPDPPRDRYGRLLADVVADGSSVSAALVERGLAWVYDGRDPALVALQARAVDARAGVHARLDRAGPAPFVVTSGRFHRRDCPWVARDPVRRELEADVARLLREGYAPCRSCLPWPP